jgi:high-affinity Fe2+/Pb2+ permease
MNDLATGLAWFFFAFGFMLVFVAPVLMYGLCRSAEQGDEARGYDR